MPEIQSRPLVTDLNDPYCPEDQSVGCESCAGEMNCLEEIHKDRKCWDDCVFCEQDKMKAEGGR